MTRARARLELHIEPFGLFRHSAPGLFAPAAAPWPPTSLPLSPAMLVMLRYAAPVGPTAVTLTGSLSVATITATALTLFHTADATVMISMWNVGTVIASALELPHFKSDPRDARAGW